MDPDYQMALLLHHQFEQENSKSHSVDFHFASKLQDDFNRELSTENPTHLVYDQKKKPGSDARSLCDASWELIDPTPNIHNLFLVFDQRFFWNKLLAVCVDWSKRMTSCAGVCSYQGRGGLCRITLSEPLLKLRPRKDLVETLLHEMIHAYLFVTHNNRDRDGHGPEFHKHMYRINKEAGTNITVYHNFHDEVRLYQQHWWRCNGPCQNRHPYFGMVRRATNRAPGPNDRWWDEHSRSCGGTYIKVKDPEKKSKSQKENKKSKGSDIRNFIPVTTNKNNPSNSNNTQGKLSNVQGLDNLKNTSANVSSVFGKGNIHGFTNLNSPGQSVVRGNTKDKTNKIGAGATKTKSNSNSTIVINKKPCSTDVNKTAQTKSENIPMFSGIGKQLVSPGKTNTNPDYSAVRNHWANKFTSTSSSNKRNTPDSSRMNENSKKQRKSEPDENKVVNIINLDDSNTNFVHCPVCKEQINELSLNDHLDICLQKQSNETAKKLCFICNKEIPQSDYRIHVDNCFDNADDELVECQICNRRFSKTKIKVHQKSCIENLFSEEVTKSPENLNERVVLAQCPICDEFIESKQLNNHKEKCLLKEFDNLHEKYELQEVETVSCLVCNKKVLTGKLSVHLEDCMGGVFDEKNNFSEPTNVAGGSKNNKSGDCDVPSEEHKYNCPFCMELYSELDMSLHLDDCLNQDVENCDKSILIDSFSNEDV